ERLPPLAPALSQRVGDDPRDERHRSDRVVVARDDEVDLVGIAVGVDDRDHRQAELAGLPDGDVLLLGVDHEDGVRQTLEVLHAAEVSLELLLLVTELQHLLLGKELKGPAPLHLAKLAHADQPTRDRLEVRQHAAQPSGGDVGHADAFGLLSHDLLGLLLRPDEQHDPAAAAQVADVSVRLLEPDQRLLEVDDVDARALPVQVPPHLRVPAPGLVPEADTRLEERPPGHDGHAPPPFGYASARLLPRRPGLRRDLGRGPRTCVLGALAPARWQSSSGFTPRPRRYRRRRSGSSGTSSSMAIHRYVKAARKPVCRKVARSAYSHVANPGLTVSRFASGANATRMGSVRKM